MATTVQTFGPPGQILNQSPARCRPHTQTLDEGAPRAAPGHGGKGPAWAKPGEDAKSDAVEGTPGGSYHQSGVSSCSSACGGAWYDGCSDASLSSAGRRRARGRWNERRLCTRRAAADRACAPGGPRRSSPAPSAGPASGASPASDASPVPGSRSGGAVRAGLRAVGGAGGAPGGTGPGVGGAWGGARGRFSGAGGTSRGDGRLVSGVSEPVSPAGEASVSAGSVAQEGPHSPSPGPTTTTCTVLGHLQATPGSPATGSAEALTQQMVYR